VHIARKRWCRCCVIAGNDPVIVESRAMLSINRPVSRAKTIWNDWPDEPSPTLGLDARKQLVLLNA